MKELAPISEIGLIKSGKELELKQKEFIHMIREIINLFLMYGDAIGCILQ